MITSPLNNLTLKLNSLYRPIDDSGNGAGELSQAHESISKFNHNYYRNGMNASLGPASIITAAESASGLLVWLMNKSPATLTNFLLSLSENLTVHVSRTKLLGEGEVGKQRREGAVAWIQLFAGLGGYSSFLMDMFSSKEHEEMSLAKKVGITALSCVNSPLMFFGFGEKALLANTSRGMEHNECDGMQLNANSDLRVVTSWTAMKVYTWLSGIKPLKLLIDVSLPMFALRDALGHFAKDGISTVFTNRSNIKLPEKISNLFKKALFIKDEDHNSSSGIKTIFNKVFMQNWFLGEGKFRDKFIIPFCEKLGCKMPSYNLERSQDGEKIISVSIPCEKKSEEVLVEVSESQKKEEVFHSNPSQDLITSFG